MTIHILGASGSGTSSLGKSLSQELNISFYDSDDFFWSETEVPYTEKRPIEDRIKLLNEAVEIGSWVISGSAMKWGDILLEKSDIIFYVHSDIEDRKRRVIKRESEKFGNRILPGNDMFKVHTDFIEWAMSYDKGSKNMRSKKSHSLWLKNAKCPVVRIKNDDFDSALKYILKEVHHENGVE